MRFKTTPYAHQYKALEMSKGMRAFAYLMEMGTGKTKVQIDDAVDLWDNGLIDCWMILAPKGVYMNWVEREIPTHMHDEVVREVAPWVTGGGLTVQRASRFLLQNSPKTLRICVMNIESLSASTKAQQYYLDFLQSGRCLVSIDESTTIKSPRARRTKFIVKYSYLAEYRRILTGSPVTRSPLDIYTQFAFLDKKILGYTSYFTFQQRYAIMQSQNFGGRQVQLVVGFRNTEELSRKIASHSYRVLKEDCLDLPPKIYLKRDVALTPEQEKIYNEMKLFATSELAGGEYVTATQVITQLLRLHQVSCGFVTDENKLVHELPNNRIDELLNAVEEVSDKVVVWCSYRHCVQTVTAALRKKYGDEAVVQYYGSTSPEDRETAIMRFQGDPTCKFFVGNPDTAGRGITLTKSPTVVYFSNNYDLEKRQQSEDRTHRIGSEIHEKITYIDLVAKGTVDERIIKALRNKINIASTITGDGYREWLI